MRNTIWYALFQILFNLPLHPSISHMDKLSGHKFTCFGLSDVSIKHRRSGELEGRVDAVLTPHQIEESHLFTPTHFHTSCFETFKGKCTCHHLLNTKVSWEKQKIIQPCVCYSECVICSNCIWEIWQTTPSPFFLPYK